jgi:hypothetical protein
MRKRNISDTGLSRRKFVGSTAATIAGFSLVPRHVLGGPGFVAPSDKVNIAIVGCGGQGRTNMRTLAQHPDAQIIALADPIELHNLDGFYYKGKAGRLPMKAEIENRYSGKNPNASYQRPAKTLPRSNGHHRDWLDACKGGKPASANFEYGAALTEIGLLGLVAIRLRKKMYWDAKTMKATNAPEADKYLKESYRPGWEVS